MAPAGDRPAPSGPQGDRADDTFRRAAVGLRSLYQRPDTRARRRGSGFLMAQGSDIPDKKVLIVDDSKFVRTTFNRILSTSFAVRECADGEAGWQAIESDSSIVMVVSDIDMPKLDGFDLLERVRGSKDLRIKSLPILIISGDQNHAAKKRTRDIGANDFIAKEADAPEVLSRIDNLLRLVKASSELEASKQVLEQTVTHDSLTGTFTPHYLMTERPNHYPHPPPPPALPP